jgi:hypothetical protein
MEAYKWTTPGSLIFTLRNVGSSSVTVVAVYLGGNPLSGITSTAVAIGASQQFSASPGTSSYTQGAAYALKVVSSSGGVFAFSVIDGSSG